MLQDHADSTLCMYLSSIVILCLNIEVFCFLSMFHINNTNYYNKAIKNILLSGLFYMYLSIVSRSPKIENCSKCFVGGQS